MNPDEADRLAKRIINTWRLTPPLDEWREALATCQPGHAGTAFIRLRNDVDGSMSIARFLREYRQIRDENTEPTRPAECQLCDGTGWVPAPDLEQRNPAGEVIHRYSQVQPCRCSNGAQAERVRQKIARDSDWHRPDGAHTEQPAFAEEF